MVAQRSPLTRSYFARCLQRFEQYSPRPTVTKPLPQIGHCFCLGGRAAASSRPASELESVMVVPYTEGEAGLPCPYPLRPYQAGVTQQSKMRMMITKIRVRIIRLSL